MRRNKKKKKKPSHLKTSCKSFPPQPPPDPKPPIHPIRSCLMFSSQSYEESFSPLENRQTHKPELFQNLFSNPRLQPLANLKNQNSMNQLGQKIDRVANQVSQTETKVDSISNRFDQMYIHLQDRISELYTNLRRMINNHIWGPEFNKKRSRDQKVQS